MSDTEKLGTPFKPLPMKCWSVGRPGKDKMYLSIVSKDGRQFCFDVSVMQARLIHSQTAEVVTVEE